MRRPGSATRSLREEIGKHGTAASSGTTGGLPRIRIQLFQTALRDWNAAAPSEYGACEQRRDESHLQEEHKLNHTSMLPHLREIFFATGAGEQIGGRAGSAAVALLGRFPAAASSASSAFTCSTLASILEKLRRRRRGARPPCAAAAAASADAAMDDGLRS